MCSCTQCMTYVHTYIGTSSESGEGGANESSRPQEHGKVGPSKSKKKKEMPRKEEKPPIEATPPGPLVALGQPRQHTMKRPRDIALGHGSTKLLTSPPASGKDNNPSAHLRTAALQTRIAKLLTVYDWLSLLGTLSCSMQKLYGVAIAFKQVVSDQVTLMGYCYIMNNKNKLYII